MSRYWHIEMALVLLKRWSPLFNPEREQVGARSIWVRLPGLPLHFWSEYVFSHIRNALITYLDSYKSYESSGNKSMAWILVYLDIREGLEAQITLHWWRFTRIQLLDYEGVPFHCRRCHKVGHLFKECPLVKLVISPTKEPDAATTGDPSIAEESISQSQGPSLNGYDDAQIHNPISPKTPSPPMTRSRATAMVA